MVNWEKLTHSAPNSKACFGGTIQKVRICVSVDKPPPWISLCRDYGFNSQSTAWWRHISWMPSNSAQVNSSIFMSHPLTPPFFLRLYFIYDDHLAPVSIDTTHFNMLMTSNGITSSDFIFSYTNLCRDISLMLISFYFLWTGLRVLAASGTPFLCLIPPQISNWGTFFLHYLSLTWWCIILSPSYRLWWQWIFASLCLARL